MNDVDRLLATYPRSRPPLPAAHARVHADEYRINRGVSERRLYHLTASLEGWMHRQVASCRAGTRLLEVGAGTLNHRPYEAAVEVYDVVEPQSVLYEKSSELSRVDRLWATIDDVPRAAFYDRIFSIAVLEHLEDLPALVAACALHLADGAVFQAGIPAEGGFLWGLAWRCTTGVSYRLRNGLSYAPAMRHEHINSAAEILAVLRHLFDEVQVRWFPLPARHLAFYGYVEARHPHAARCAALGRGRS